MILSIKVFSGIIANYIANVYYHRLNFSLFDIDYGMKGENVVQFDNNAVGQTIRRLRNKRGISQDVLSGFAGIARTHLTMIENGSKQANFETVWKIANALDMRPSELVAQIECEIEKNKA